MAEPAKKLATYADLEAVSPLLVAEIIDGGLVTHPRPVPRHAVAAGMLNVELVLPFQRGRGGPGGWIFMGEPELHFGSQVVVPDMAGWRRERLTLLPDAAFITTAPDWLCEILSPSTEKYDRGAKRRIYVEAGVQHIWLLDPRMRILETFTSAAGRWMLTGTFSDADEVRAPPFESIGFPLENLWLSDAGETSKTQSGD